MYPGQVAAVGCPGDEQGRVENKVRRFLLGSKTQALPRVGSDLIVPLKDTALCPLRIKRQPFLGSSSWAVGERMGVIAELIHDIKRHLLAFTVTSRGAPCLVQN